MIFFYDFVKLLLIMKKWAKNSALAIGVSVKPDVSLVALVNVSQKGFASIVNVSEKIVKNYVKTFFREFFVKMKIYLYLSWTFCFISTRFVAEMSRSKYSERVSVAFSKSFWLSYKRREKTQKTFSVANCVSIFTSKISLSLFFFK